MNNINLFIVIFVFSLLGCNKKNSVNLSDKEITDSIFYYTNKSNLTISKSKDLEKHSKRALELITLQKNSSKNRSNLYNLITDYYNLENWDNYNKASKLLLKNSLSAKDTIYLAKAYRSRGNYFNYLRNSDSSFYYFVKAENIYRKIKDYEGYSTILLKKGILQVNKNDYNGAQNSLNLAYNLFKNKKDKQKIYIVLNELGLISRELNDFDKAIDYHTKALEIVEEFNLKNEEHQDAICLSNLGLVYEYKKDYRTAIQYYEKSLKDKSIKKDNAELYSNIIDYLAFSKIESNDLSNLPNLFYESLEIRKEIKNISAITLSNIHLSMYYNKINEYTKSIKFANTALTVAKQSKIPFDIVEALKQAAAVDKLNASQHTNDYIRINDSLLTAERKNIDRFARIQLETDEVIKENQNLGRINQNLIYYIIGFGVLAVIGSLLVVIFRQRSKQNELLFLQSQQEANENIYQLLLAQQAKVAEVRQSEKSRIALELHDGIMNKLASTRLNLFVLSKKTDPYTIAKCLTHIANIQIIETEIRNVAHDLKQEVFSEKNSFKLLLTDFIADQNAHQTTQYKLEIDEKINWENINNPIKINLFRILQEATSNCNKYAKATQAVIAFVLDENQLCMSVVDNGVGTNLLATKNGIGVQNMKQRIKLLGGVISIVSEPEKGTKINLAVPLAKS